MFPSPIRVISCHTLEHFTPHLVNRFQTYFSFMIALKYAIFRARQGFC
jgi:hypothetical protein